MRLLDYLKNPLKELPKFESLIWHERFYDCGNIEFHYQDYVQDAVYIYNTENKQLAILEDTDVTDQKTVYTGRMIKSLLNNKVISSTKVYTNKTAEYIAKDLVASFAGQGIQVEAVQGYQSTTLMTLQVTGDNLMSYTDSLLKQYKLGATIDYDYVNGIMTYKVLESTDNTLAKEPLAQNFGTLIDNTFSKVTSSYKNFAYISGEVIDGQQTIVETVDLRASVDDEKREIWIDARDLQSTVYINDVEVILTDAEYRATLKAKGFEQLMELPILIGADMTANDKFVLGEIRQLKTNNVISEEQITEIITSYEKNAILQDAVFGTQSYKIL